MPLEALTYSPSRSRTSKVATAAGSQWGLTLASGAAAITSGTQGHIFLLQDGQPHGTRVRILLVAGTDAAIQATSGTLPAGGHVVIADDANPTPRATVNPSQPFGQAPRTGPR